MLSKLSSNWKMRACAGSDPAAHSHIPSNSVNARLISPPRCWLTHRTDWRTHYIPMARGHARQFFELLDRRRTALWLLNEPGPPLFAGALIHGIRPRRHSDASVADEGTLV